MKGDKDEMHGKKYCIDLRIPGKNGVLKGVYLYENEVWVLLLLHHFRKMTTQQLYAMTYPNKEITYDSFAKKMRLWVIEKRSSFIKSKRLFPKDTLLRTNLISLTERGFNILEKNYFIPAGERFKTTANTKPIRHSPHRNGLMSLCSKLIHTIEVSKGEKITFKENEFVSFQRFLPEGIFFDGWDHTERERTFIEGGEDEVESVQLYSINPTYHPYRLESVEEVEENELKKERLQPDWIFLYKDQVLNIEVDTGTESHTQLKGKLKGYTEITESSSEYSRFAHTILFGVIEDSISSPDLPTVIKEGRIRNIKETFQDEDHLPIYALSVVRTDTFFASYFIREGEFGDEEGKGSMCKGLFRWLHITKSFPLEFEFEFSSKERIQKIISDEINVEIELLALDSQKRVSLVLYIEEGSVRDYKRVKTLNAALHERRLPGARVYLLYDTEGSMREDVLPIQLHPDILLGSVKKISGRQIKFYNAKERVVSHD